MSEDPRVKAAARALAEYDGQNPDAGVPNVDLTADPLWLRYEPRAYAALAAADAAAWRPIKEVPDDGKFLCYCPHYTMKYDTVTAEIHRRAGKWIMTQHLGCYKLPTHFMPLPAPPQEQDT